MATAPQPRAAAGCATIRRLSVQKATTRSRPIHFVRPRPRDGLAFPVRTSRLGPSRAPSRCILPSLFKRRRALSRETTVCDQPSNQLQLQWRGVDLLHHSYVDAALSVIGRSSARRVAKQLGPCDSRGKSTSVSVPSPLCHAMKTGERRVTVSAPFAPFLHFCQWQGRA